MRIIKSISEINNKAIHYISHTNIYLIKIKIKLKVNSSLYSSDFLIS